MTEARPEPKFAWWVLPYLCILALICAITDSDPDIERMNYWIDRGIRFKDN